MKSIFPILSAGGPLLFRQLFETVSCTYTYLLADSVTKNAVIIDPVLEKVERDANLITDLGLKLGPIIDTHLHADHVTGSGQLKKRFPGSYSVIGDYKKVIADQKVKHGDRIRFGNFEIECRSTPGHTSSCLTLVMHKVGAIFTGDTLFVRGCGRTDFPGSSAEQLHDSVHTHIFSLPDEYLVFPGHDYAGFLYTTVGEEKMYNPRLRKSKEEFIEIMKNLKLDLPKQIKRASQLNPVGGIEN